MITSIQITSTNTIKLSIINNTINTFLHILLFVKHIKAVEAEVHIASLACHDI